MDQSISSPPSLDNSVTVVVSTFGDKTFWAPLAERAIRSVQTQTLEAGEILWMHGETLAEARNRGGYEAKSEWLIFLDADDGLDPGYIQAMVEGSGDVRQPATLGVYPDGKEDQFPVLIPQRDLYTGNYLIIGSMVRQSLFARVRGFEEYPILEDWQFWLKCYLAGAEIGKVPEAIYRVSVNPESRNNNPALHGRTYERIRSWAFQAKNGLV